MAWGASFRVHHLKFRVTPFRTPLPDADQAGARLASRRRRAEQQYAPEVVVSRYCDLYERARAALAARR